MSDMEKVVRYRCKWCGREFRFTGGEVIIEGKRR